MAQDIVQIDAFTAEAFAGNPAAVCLMTGPADEHWMRLVAREMNLSETAFLFPIDGGYSLRWFTPRAEVDLCGHATLATAHLLFEDGHVAPESVIHFKTRSGWVSASADNGWIILDFPANPPEVILPPPGLINALGVNPSYVGAFPGTYLVEVASGKELRGLDPNMSILARLERPKVCVTSIDASGQADFLSRLFAPALGIAEDPVNGNSHTALTPYWSNKLGKILLIGRQASERGGVLKVELSGSRVKIGGQAVTVMRGKLT